MKRIVNIQIALISYLVITGLLLVSCASAGKTSNQDASGITNQNAVTAEEDSTGISEKEEEDTIDVISEPLSGLADITMCQNSIRMNTSPDGISGAAVNVRYPFLIHGHYIGGDVTGSNDKYVALDKVIDEINEDIRDTYMGFYDAFVEYITEFAGDDANQYDGSYIDQRGYLMRADEKALSLFVFEENYATGAMHPLVVYHAYNYDPVTGEKISLADVVKDISSLADVLEKEVRDHYPGKVFDENTGHKIRQSIMEDDGNIVFSVSYSGVGFYFQDYFLTGYSNGQMVFLSFEEYPELFEKRFYEVPERYAWNPPGYGDQWVRTLNSGNELRTIISWDNDRYTGTLQIFVEEDIQYEIPVIGEEPDMLLVHMENGDYLHLGIHTSSDYMQLDTVDLNHQREEVDVRYGIGAYLSRGVSFDPDHLYYRVSSATRYSSYYAGFGCESTACFCATKDGVPELTEETLALSSDGLILNMDVKAGLLNGADDDKGEPVTVQTGTTLYMFRSDTETWLDMNDDEGNIYRFEISGQPATYEGQQVELLLIEGILDEELFAPSW